ncbi:MAG: tetratricopeptide repeat protein [Kiritimatiellae bacterium]|nr:tetratricopeptide repeat protein [Kiritimatiellia bacterium]
MMKLSASIAVLLLVLLPLAAATNDVAAAESLAVARRALGDELWQIARTKAVEAAASTSDAATRALARQVELESLAGAGKPAEILARLDAWTDAGGDVFRYWRAWSLARLGRAADARAVLAAPFADPVYEALSLRLAARLDVEAGDRAAAAAHFARASAALASNAVARAENAVEWARTLDAAGMPADALDVLRKEGVVMARGAAGDAARLLEARLLAKTGDGANGVRLLEKLVAGGTNTEERAYVLAACDLSDLLLAGGSTNRALQVASNAVGRASRPDLACRAGYTLGFALFASPTNRAAGVALVTDLVRRYPENPQSGAAQLRLADGLLAAGDAAGAVREYDVLLQSYPSHALDAHVLEGRGWAFLRLGRSAEAVGLFARAAQVTTNDEVRARCTFKQAEALSADGRHEESAAVYAGVALAGMKEQARFRQADELSRAKQTAAAGEIFRALFAEGGETAVEAGVRAAAAELTLGRVEQSVEAFSRVLDEKAARKPTPEQRGRALSGRGRALYRAYRFAEAARDFAEVARLQPDRQAEMGFFGALCLYGDGREREAYERARNLLAGLPEGSPLRGDLQMWLAKYDAGRREWLAAIAGFEACAANTRVDDTQRIEALVRAVRCAVSMPDYAKAVELAARVATNAVAVAAMSEPRPESAFVAEAMVLQGEALIELARFDDAVMVLERACLVPAPPPILRRAAIAQADCLFAMGADDANRYRGALAAYRTLLQDADLSDSLRISVAFKVGRTLEKLGLHDEAAAQYYDKVVEAYWNAVRPDASDTKRRRWFDGNARALFARAAFILADYHEARGEPAAAANVLSYVVAARVPAADEAAQRIARLKEKGGFR